MPHENGRVPVGARIAAGSLLAALAAGCGAAAPKMAPESPATEDAAPTNAEEALDELSRAEQELDRLLPASSRFATAPGSAAPPPPSPSGAYGQPAEAPRSPAVQAPEPAVAPAAKRDEEREMSAQSEGADGCATACRALSSMRRAATHLCDLAGDSDARCDSAKGRVANAEERVRASCSDCE